MSKDQPGPGGVLLFRLGHRIRRTECRLRCTPDREGKFRAADKVASVSFSSKINLSSHLKYKVDYDVGDRVTCLNRRWGVKIDARTTETQEAYESENSSGEES
jgi:hypothetical protein